MTAGVPRENCQNCGYTKKYSRQKPGERPAYCQSHHRAWLCEGCREDLGCVAHHHKIEALPPRVDVTGIPPNDGIYSSIPDDVYHADLGSLSSSGARALLSTTPEEFEFNRRTPPDPKRQFDFGHAAHKMVLGKGSSLAMLDPAVHGLKADGKPAHSPTSTSLWKQAAAKARRDGKIPMARVEMEKAQTMAGRVYQHRIAARLLSAGQAEHSIYWHDDATGVRRRIRPDFITEGLGRTICVDYKTATSANPAQFQRAVAEYGYHMQQAYYEDGLAELGLTDVGFLFVVQAKSAPYTVSVCQIEPEAVELGRRQNRRALELFARCTAENRWPGYDGIQTVGLPGYAVRTIEDSLEGDR
jgi:hypothetical protein